MEKKSLNVSQQNAKKVPMIFHKIRVVTKLLNGNDFFHLK